MSPISGSIRKGSRLMRRDDSKLLAVFRLGVGWDYRDVIPVYS